MDSYLDLTSAAKLLPKRPAVSTVWRWCRQGVRTRTGDRVRLGHVQLGSRLYTTEADLERFAQVLAEKNAATFEQTPRTPRPATSTRREREIAASEANLRREGLL